MADVTAVIVTFNSEDTIDTALWSLRPSHESGLLECIVVDNASSDQTVQCVERHPWVRLIRNVANVGFGCGCNIGLRDTSTRYVMFMNPDATLNQTNLRKLISFLNEHPWAGLVGPAIVEADGTLQAAGGLPTPWSVVAQAVGGGVELCGRRPIRPGARPFTTDWLCGALLVAPTSLMQALQGFDERYFLYFEETDLCYRVRDAGAEIWAVGEAVAYHTSCHSALQTRKELYAGCIAEYYFASRFYYLAKHHGVTAAAAAEACELMLLLIRALMTAVRGRGCDHIIRRFHAPKFRYPKAVQS